MTDDDGYPDPRRGGDFSLLIDDDEREERRTRRRRRQRASGLRRLLGVLLTFVVLAGLVVGVYVGGKAVMGTFGGTDVPDFEGAGTGSVQVRVAQGDTATDIGATLFDAGVVASQRAFQDAAVENPDSRSIQPGVYGLRLQMSAAAAVELLLDPASRLTEVVTIPEGFTVVQVLAALAEVTGTPLAEYQSAAAQVDQLGLPDYAAGRLEGFLFPATYELDPEATPLEVLRTLVDKYNQVAADLQLESRAAALGLSPYEALIVGSMIQAESRIDGERGQIATVIYNRLEQDIPLGIDATSAYELNKPGDELTTDDLQNDTPYNTRVNLGLVPTPISNPGEASLEAALAPTPGPWTYYVLQDEEGNHFFTDDPEEFLEAKAACEAAGLGCG